ncbi:MerR family transcriptional regulator [Microbacterium sp. NPDC077391]|uniref:MerR family transcriptional regulator n=1 Tax=Microbacterium commune TaxID=2762219 RepID=A0ABR8W4V0_9MICO|nr:MULTISPECIES: MerR family transcriptional regulator [Microbacterium]MBD8011706.1 MerR family transcriptional regulator [Microbacterium commune]OIU87149.1 MerR family transcriptional regulator [Microbacterium sp. AR7-10]
MLSIGAFAQIGQVTHRMLRHWDTAGLLVPAHVDEHSGYRSYDPSQLHRLHRIVALRQLGFGLEQIGVMLDEGIDGDRLMQMLRGHRDAVEREHRIATERLVDVERRLHLIESENRMSSAEFIEKPLPAVRLIARTATVPADEVGRHVGAMFGEVEDGLPETEGMLETPIAQYRPTDDGVLLTIGYAYAGDPVEGLEIIELAAEERAVCGIHLGAMSGIRKTWHGLHTEMLARGFVPSGPCRELYVRSWPLEDESRWVTELQQPVSRA